MYLLTPSKNGISATDLKRQPGVSYNSAWMIKHKLMQAMREREDSQPLRGIVELDDAYLGGETSGGKRGRGAARKTPFLAAAQVSADGRPERLRLSPVSGFRRRAVAAWARRQLQPGTVVRSDGLDNLEHLQRIGFQANRRLLRVERLSHDCSVGAERFEQLHASAEIAGQRAPSLRFGDRRVQALLGALAAFRLLPRGFTHPQLRERVAALLGTTLEAWSPGRMTYDLRRLRLRGLIERIPRSRRYRVTDEGIRLALCFQRTYARVLRPSLSVIFDDAAEAPTPLQKAVQRFDREIDRLWEGRTIAA